jgi:carnitine 3-dehydrogenase
MTESRYGVEFGYATDAFLRHVGLDAAYLDGGHSAYTVEGHIRFLREAAALEPIAVDTQVIAADEKRLHVFHSMRHGYSGELLATGEYMLLHVDTAEGRTCPWEEPVASRVSEAAAAHVHLPVPEGAGRAVSMPRSD